MLECDRPVLSDPWACGRLLEPNAETDNRETNERGEKDSSTSSGLHFLVNWDILTVEVENMKKQIFLLFTILSTIAVSGAAQDIYLGPALLPPGVQRPCPEYMPDRGQRNCLNLRPDDPRLFANQKRQAEYGRAHNLDYPAAWKEPILDRVFTIDAGGAWPMSFYVPERAEYSGSFEAFDESSDVRQTLLDAAGKRYTPIKTKEEVEIDIMEDAQYVFAFSRGNPWTGNLRRRGMDGEFNVTLEPGTYWLVLNNRFSITKPKSVTLKLYRPRINF